MIKHSENPDGSLNIEVTDRKALLNFIKENGLDPNSDQAMYDVFLPMLANSELDWINPEDCGALTSAPLLAILDSDGLPIKVWGFMDYQVKSVVNELLEKNFVTFVKG